MRVLQVVHGFPPWAMGGSEVYTHDLSRALARRSGVEVFVLTREADSSLPDYHVREETRDGITLTIVNNTFSASRSFEDSYRQPEIRRIAAALLDEIRPDIVHVQHLTCLSTDIPFECSRRGIPIVATLHDFWFICHRGQLLDERLERCAGPYPSGCGRCVGTVGAVGPAAYRAATLLRRFGIPLPSAFGPIAATARLGAGAGSATEASAARLRHMREVCATFAEVLAPSRTVRERFVEFGIPAARITQHPYGIDQARLSAVPRSSGDRGDRLRIGFLGSLMVSKAPHVLLEAFEQLPPGSGSVHVYGGHAAYHGDDSYRLRLEPLLRRPGVHWAGPVPRERIPEVLGSLDVLVVPSIWLENSPLVIHEAFAAGLPVIASNLGGMAEAVTHERDGLLFEPGDAAALGRALTRLIDDPGLLERLRAGIGPVRSIDDDADSTFALYRRHVDSAREPVSQAAPADPAAQGGKLAAIVLNYRTPVETERAVASLIDSQRSFATIIVVDNGSTDASADALRRALPDATILASSRNLGFSGGCNLGIAEASRCGAQLVLLVNSDAVLAPDAVRRMEEALLADDRNGIAVPVLLSAREPGRILSAGIAYSTLTGRMRHHRFGLTHRPAGEAGHRAAGAAGEVGEVRKKGGAAWSVADAGSGCVMLIRREVLERVGTLEESFFFSFEDVDFCLRARRAGFSTVVVADALAWHDVSLSIGARSARKLYFATRNHLHAAARAGERRFPIAALRFVWIVALNVAFALRAGGAPRLDGVRNVLVGAWHHLRGRYGDGPREAGTDADR